jgi:hypothetical protein
MVKRAMVAVVGVSCAAAMLTGQPSVASGGLCHSTGGKHAPYVVGAVRDNGPGNANAYWFALDDVLCAQTLRGTAKDTSRARVIVPRRGGAVVAQVVDHGGDDKRTCKRFNHAAKEGARGSLRIMRVNPSGVISYGANNDMCY